MLTLLKGGNTSVTPSVVAVRELNRQGFPPCGSAEQSTADVPRILRQTEILERRMSGSAVDTRIDDEFKDGDI